MARSKNADFDLNRLCESIHYSRRDLERFRIERKEAVRQYIGGHWSDEGSDQKVPVNLISLYTQIIGRSLIPNNPRYKMSTFVRGQKPTVSAMETWSVRQVEKMGLGSTLQRCAIDAIYSIGICKVSIVDPAHSSLWGWKLKAGTAYAERVDLDDFVFDTHARDFREAAYMGHRFRVPLSAVKDSTLYNKNRKDLEASDDKPYNREGDERISVLQRGGQLQSREFEDMVDLWEIYLPRQNLVVTIPDEYVLGAAGREAGFDAVSLREVEWVGPDEGPYHTLGFGVVPGNAMPKGTIQDLIDLHKCVNQLYMKLMRQGEDQKTVTVVAGQATEDGERIIQADDGTMIRVDNPDKVKIASYGGPDQNNLQFVIHLVDRFSYMGGNMDAMGGLSPQAKTLGQDRMLMESSSRTVNELQETTLSFVSRVGKALGWYWWHDPFQVMRVEHTVDGMPETAIVREVHPRGSGQMLSREADWEELDLKVDPYSLQFSTPQQQVQKLLTVMQQVMLPLAGVMQQQNVGFDIAKLLEIVGKRLDLPELAEVVTILEQPQQPAAGGEEPGMPAATSREYTRHSAGQTAETRQAGITNQTSPGQGGSGMSEPQGM